MNRTILSIGAAFIVAGASAQMEEPGIIPGHLLVMIQEGPEEIIRDLAVLDGVPTGLVAVRELSPPTHIWLLQFDADAIDQSRMLDAVRRHRVVLIAQNDHVIKERIVPNDTQF